MSNLRRVGREAEDRAADYLIGLGYTIVKRRYKAAHGEIDILAMDGEALVVVEVKERLAMGHVPEESVGEKKAARMASAAREYLAATGETDRAIRFDLVVFDRDGLRHHADAFKP